MERIEDAGIIGAGRTAIGGFGRGLKNNVPTALAAMVLREAASRADLTPADPPPAPMLLAE